MVDISTLDFEQLKNFQNSKTQIKPPDSYKQTKHPPTEIFKPETKPPIVKFIEPNPDEFNITSYFNYNNLAYLTTIPIIYASTIIGRMFFHKASIINYQNTQTTGSYVQTMAKAFQTHNENTENAAMFLTKTSQIRETHGDLLSSLSSWKGGDIKKIAGTIIQNDITNLQKFASNYQVPILITTALVGVTIGAYYTYEYLIAAGEFTQEVNNPDSKIEL